jgi:uncharacterized metal-binding protein YceD (DUF177 family)
MTPELHRPIAVERVGRAGLDVTVKADAAESAALARRMDLPAVQSLTCRFRLEQDASGEMIAHGHLAAHVVQTCIVSLEDFATIVEERFTVRCVPQGEETDDVDPETPDEITCVDGILDLGEAAAEQLALALDPYPRAPGAELPEIEGEPDAHSFDALAALKRPN